MNSVVGLLIVLVIKVKILTGEELNYNNGWRPLSTEMVLESLNRKFVKIPNIISSSVVHWNPISLDDKFTNIERNADVKPHHINRELLTEDYNEGIVIDKKENQVRITDKEGKDEEEHLLQDTRNIHKPKIEYRRTAKNFMQSQENFYKNALESNENKSEIVTTIKAEHSKSSDTNNISENSKIYEVTEAYEASEAKDLLTRNEGRDDVEKAYFTPNIETTTEKSLSNTLLSILGNYNIRINDNLTNYGLSRYKQGSNYSKQSYVYSVPRVPPMRNSQNYFPIDPLLAVFLSNYGYYLPGLYGFPGNYYNIYGYLASNNIHNNKPFGAYKIYSDTDSSQ